METDDSKDEVGVEEITHIGQLIPDPQNARSHNERNIKQIVDSLQEVGAARSIVLDEDNIVLAGNGVIEAAGIAGIENVRVVEADGNEIIAVKRRGLTPEQKRRLALWDNRAGELATWDADVLGEMYQEDPAVFDNMFSAGEIQFELGVFIEHQDGDRAGASPWERIGDDISDGVLVKIGEITCTSPYSIEKNCDAVCVGDGQNFLKVLFNEGFDAAAKLPNVWIDGEERRVEIDNSFPWDMPPIQAEDNAYRLWCGRGCKNKCKFCQTGWAYRYSENPDPKFLIHQANALINNGKKISYLSNDLSQHSFYNMLPPSSHGSYSIKYLKANGLPPARQIRLGVEGVSEMLRKSVSKPISDVDLVGCTRWLNENKKSVRWFMIAGLPGETDKDWECLRDVVQQWKKQTEKGVLALSFTAFCPDPATPFVTASLNDDYWEYFTNFKEWFFGGVGWSNRVKLMSPQQPKSRMKKAILSTGLDEKQLRKGGYLSPNKRLLYPYEKQAASLNC